jgi:hypothetical protein
MLDNSFSILGRPNVGRPKGFRSKDVKLPEHLNVNFLLLHYVGATTFSIMTLSIMTLSIMTLSIMTLSKMTLSIMTLSIMTLSIMTLSITIN